VLFALKISGGYGLWQLYYSEIGDCPLLTHRLIY